MFVAHRTSNNTRVTSIARQWDSNVEALRQMAASGDLVCPGCEQLLWLRTGELRRRHFAHRTLKECPLGHKSAELFDAQFQLYRWLDSKFPGQVEMELALPDAGDVKAPDLQVQLSPEVRAVYWLLDRQMHHREALLNLRRRPNLHVHFIHTQSALKLNSDSELALTASQRDFTTVSGFDRLGSVPGDGHLCFLNTEESNLLIYRGLWMVHSPNLFCWSLLTQCLLQDALVSPKTGEIVTTEDKVRLEERQEVRRREKQRQEERARLLEQQQKEERERLAKLENEKRERMERISSLESVRALQLDVEEDEEEEAVVPDALSESPAIQVLPTLPPIEETAEEETGLLNDAFECEDCGRKVTEWSQVTPATRKCVCVPCVAKRREKMLAALRERRTPR